MKEPSTGQTDLVLTLADQGPLFWKNPISFLRNLALIEQEHRRKTYHLATEKLNETMDLSTGRVDRTDVREKNRCCHMNGRKKGQTMQLAAKKKLQTVIPPDTAAADTTLISCSRAYKPPFSWSYCKRVLSLQRNEAHQL